MIRASSIGAIIGLSPWRTPLQAWMEARGETVSEDNPSMAEGRAMESVILSEWERLTGGRITDQQREVQIGPIVGHIDGIGTLPDGRRVLVEAKWAARGIGKDAMASYWCQVQAYLAALEPEGIEVAHLVSRGPGAWSAIEPIQRDPSGWADIYAAVVEWHARHIIGGEPPEPTGPAERAQVALSRLRDAGAVLRAEEALDHRVRSLLEARRAIAEAESRVKEVEAELLEAMVAHGAIAAEGPGWRVQVVERAGSPRWKDIATALGASPEVIEAHRGAATKYLRWKEVKDE